MRRAAVEANPKTRMNRSTLTWFSGSGVDANTKTMEALAEAFQEENPDITIKVDASGPSGPEIDNLMKTRLATGEMPDMFWYNSGSLMQALNPDQTMLNIEDEHASTSSNDAFVLTVSTETGVFGVPVRPPAAAASSTTSRSTRSSDRGPPDLGRVPRRTARDQDAGYDAGRADLRRHAGPRRSSRSLTSTTSTRSDPDWADEVDRERGQVRRRPGRGAELQRSCRTSATAGFINEDFASATLDDGLKAVATGDGGELPDARLRAEHHRDELPRQRRRHRLLRDAR